MESCRRSSISFSAIPINPPDSNSSHSNNTPSNNNNNCFMMIHPTCGSDLRRSTKVAAMIDSILAGFSIFCAIAVLNNMFSRIIDPEVSAFPVGCLILFLFLMGLEMYLAFRLYRAAHERDVMRLQAWKKASGAVMGICTLFVLMLHHMEVGGPYIPPLSPVIISPFPLLWFYVVYYVAAIFRCYMLWIVFAFVSEFELT